MTDTSVVTKSGCEIYCAQINLALSTCRSTQEHYFRSKLSDTSKQTMWFKSARPAAFVASVLAYGVVNKGLLQYTDSIEENVEKPLGLEAKKAKARQAIQRQMVSM
ncbi:unnamed protein product [Angiostrongylus costaricensis]|uniref:HIG1 domain-containing protein n=1 Tax=Angiostrongylus costaricensis TaxID=334426 RepID=A0A0R3PAX7_ANGCS|nr:unnamed protein product [Angiostrongylus costaricensis]